MLQLQLSLEGSAQCVGYVNSLVYFTCNVESEKMLSHGSVLCSCRSMLKGVRQKFHRVMKQLSITLGNPSNWSADCVPALHLQCVCVCVCVCVCCIGSYSIAKCSQYQNTNEFGIRQIDIENSCSVKTGFL